MSLEKLIPSNTGEESRGILEEPLEGFEKTNKQKTIKYGWGWASGSKFGP